MKKGLIAIILAIGFVFTVSPADARRQKSISPEDVRALQNIGIDLRHASAAEINQKAAAIERLVSALKGISEARILEANARRAEVKAAQAELKLQQQMQNAGFTQKKRQVSFDAKQRKVDAKNDPLNPYGRTISRETNKTLRDVLDAASERAIRGIFGK